MESKIISCVLVASLLFSVGCYGTGIVSKDELKAKPKQVDITVYTKDSLEYRFSQGTYHILADTLSGSGVRLSASRSDSVVASIALADISSIETSEFSYVKTFLLILGFGAIIYVIIVGNQLSHT